MSQKILLSFLGHARRAVASIGDMYVFVYVCMHVCRLLSPLFQVELRWLPLTKSTQFFLGHARRAVASIGDVRVCMYVCVYVTLLSPLFQVQ